MCNMHGIYVSIKMFIDMFRIHNKVVERQAKDAKKSISKVDH